MHLLDVYRLFTFSPPNLRQGLAGRISEVFVLREIEHHLKESFLNLGLIESPQVYRRVIPVTEGSGRIKKDRDETFGLLHVPSPVA